MGGRKKKRKRFNAENSIRRWNVVLPLTGSFAAVLVLGASIPLDAQDATAIYDYLESQYYERLEQAADRKKEAALKYLGVS